MGFHESELISVGAERLFSLRRAGRVTSGIMPQNGIVRFDQRRYRRPQGLQVLILIAFGVVLGAVVGLLPCSKL